MAGVGVLCVLVCLGLEPPTDLVRVLHIGGHRADLAGTFFLQVIVKLFIGNILRYKL